ncbi:MAG: NAD(P)-dependent oxidoreductase [Lagierella massiliensis]|nr:NAD(P)-dependent oxidoreductase [Lagierella massiliensis]
MRYLPVAIDSRGKKINIIGGGVSALIKLKGFLKAEFTIKVLADEFLEEFYTLENKYKDRLILIKEKITDDYDISSCDYLVLATDNLKLNETLTIRAKSLKVPVLNTSSPSKSDFILNKIIEKNDISFSISTDSKAPGLSKYLATELSDFLDGLDFEKIDLIIDFRQALKMINCKSIKEEMIKAYVMEKEELRSSIKNIYENKNRNKGE